MVKIKNDVDYVNKCGKFIIETDDQLKYGLKIHRFTSFIIRFNGKNLEDDDLKLIKNLDFVNIKKINRGNDEFIFIEMGKKYSFNKALRLKRLQDEIIFIPFLNDEMFFE